MLTEHNLTAESHSIEKEGQGSMQCYLKFRNKQLKNYVILNRLKNELHKIIRNHFKNNPGMKYYTPYFIQKDQVTKQKE